VQGLHEALGFVHRLSLDGDAIPRVHDSAEGIELGTVLRGDLRRGHGVIASVLEPSAGQENRSTGVASLQINPALGVLLDQVEHVQVQVVQQLACGLLFSYSGRHGGLSGSTLFIYLAVLRIFNPII